jgi:ankyrin repeat protein
MSESMAQGMLEAVAKDRSAFLELGPEGLNTLHSLALGGSAACVEALLSAGADPLVTTRSGKTARDLATLMDWPRVVELLRAAETSRPSEREPLGSSR